MQTHSFKIRSFISLFCCFLLGSLVTLSAQKPELKGPNDTSKQNIRPKSYQKTVQEKKTEVVRLQKEAAEKEKTAPTGFPTSTAVQEFPASTPAFIRDSLDSYIERGMSLWQIPGLAIAIVKDGKIILSKGYGTREKGWKEEKVDENTLFIIASNTKLFTGTSLAKLDFEKKLSLNDRVTKYLPWFRLYDTTATRLVNIRDLLCHRIGLKTFQGYFTFRDSNLPKDSIILKLRELEPTG